MACRKKERLYNIWIGMRQRCHNPKSADWARYGGRGISICAEWDNDYAAFKDWALQHGYKDDLSIDRINNDGNYEPRNCRWATAKEQAANSSRYQGGITMTKTEEMLNVALAPELKRDLGRVSTFHSRTMRRQAALYIQRGVERDMRRMSK